MMLPHPVVLEASQTPVEFARFVTERPSVRLVLVQDQGRLVGFVRRESALDVLNAQPPVATLGELADQRYVTVGGRTSLFDVLARMRAHGAHIALVSDSASTHFAEQIKGVITRVQLADAMVDGAELYVD